MRNVLQSMGEPRMRHGFPCVTLAMKHLHLIDESRLVSKERTLSCHFLHLSMTFPRQDIDG